MYIRVVGVEISANQLVWEVAVGRKAWMDGLSARAKGLPRGVRQGLFVEGSSQGLLGGL